MSGWKGPLPVVELDEFTAGWVSFRVDARYAAMIRALLFSLGIHAETKSQCMRLLIEACHRRICQHREE